MFAVICSGGKQYKVAENDVIIVETLAGEPGSTIELSEVLMIGGDGFAPRIGSPLLAKASVTAKIIEHSRAPKIIIFKKKRRKNYRRKTGHRQNQTILRIAAINAVGHEIAANAAAPAGKTAAGKAGTTTEIMAEIMAEAPAMKIATPKAAAKKASKAPKVKE